jgi:hypothetical protein
MKKCFVIMPITTPDSILSKYRGDKEHFIHVYEHLIVPAIEKTGLEAVPPITKGSELIHDEVIKNLISADVVLCDMSSLNPNVFFELGIRTALNKPISLIKDDLTASIPFDISPINYHTYLSGLSIWEIEKEIVDLSNHLINTVEKKGDSNSLWNRFGFNVQAQPIKGREGIEGRLEVLSLQMDGLSRQIEKNNPPRVDTAMFRDFAVDQNRSAVIADLTTLAARAQQFHAKPLTLGGGGNSFATGGNGSGITADAAGLALLASTAFTDNANGTYTVKTAGTATQVVLRGVGKAALSDGTFPVYDMTVTAETQSPTRIN